MRKPPRKPGIVRLTEETNEIRNTIKTATDFNAPTELGHFCTGCRKWDSFLRASQNFCKACVTRMKVLGIKGE